MVNSDLTRPRLLAVGVAVVALAFAACGHNNSTSPAPVASVTAVPTASASAGAAATPCAISLGIAYEPDGGNGGSLTGIQYTHFEDNSENLCPASNVSPAPRLVGFSSAVGGLGFASDASDAVALLKNTSGGYTLAQDIFGTAVGSLTPVGSPYDLSIEPTPIPTGEPSSGASPSASATPANAPLLSDAQSVSILGGSSSAVALALGVPAAGATPAIVALTSLTNAPPQYGNAVPFTGASYTLASPPAYPRNIVKVGTDTGGNTVALARGPQDLVSFAVSIVATGYQFNLKAEDSTLGTFTTLRGSGAMAFDPADSGRALIGGESMTGTGNVLTLITGLPNAITRTTTLALPGGASTVISSIAIASTGAYALVGTNVGIFSIDGVNGSTLTVVSPFSASSLASTASAPVYTTCTGSTATLTNVASIGISSDQRYLVALGTGAGVTCPSGYNDAIVAVPYNPATGGTPSPGPSPTATGGVVPSPVPTSFVQNNVIAPPTGADLMYVH